MLCVEGHYRGKRTESNTVTMRQRIFDPSTGSVLDENRGFDADVSEASCLDNKTVPNSPATSAKWHMVWIFGRSSSFADANLLVVERYASSSISPGPQRTANKAGH
jgi:hypothetical protein